LYIIYYPANSLALAMMWIRIVSHTDECVLLSKT